MTKILDWKRSDDVRDIVHLSVQALAEGHIVALPSCTHYFAAAGGIDSNACRRLLEDFRSPPGVETDDLPAASLLVRGADEIQDYCPESCGTARRLATRMWPGPLHLLLPGDHAESLLGRLPAAARQAISDSRGYFRVCLPAHPAVAEITRLTAGPLILRPLPNRRDGSLATTPEGLEHDAISLLVDDGPTKFRTGPTVVEIRENCCRIARAGVTSRSELQSVSRLVVLLVCTGNTCRSPMAEAILEEKLRKYLPRLQEALRVPGAWDKDFVPIVAISAGIAGGDGPASPQAVTALAERGIDLSQHRSCALTTKDVEAADIILAMTRGHQQAIISRWPAAAAKCHLVSGGAEDVSDPFGGPVPLYRQCADKLDEYLERWIERLADLPLPRWTDS